MPVITLEELMEAGVHFGHQTKRWNPKMKPYIWGKRNGIYIIDLTKTVPLFEQAYQAVKETAASGKKVLFVGTKKQAADIVREEADRVGALYINKRWLGGTLTNSSVIRARIKYLMEIEELKENGHLDKMNKKEQAVMNRSLAKLQRSLGGLKGMRGEPGLVVIIDQKREINAVTETRKAGVPIVTLLDTNADPTLSDYNIPANDDALKSLKLLVGRLADAVAEGTAERESALSLAKEQKAADDAKVAEEAAEAKKAKDAELATAGAAKSAEDAKS
jgi:small subunit ribosomal protein S2